jgi:D-glycero-alpha-D-manno-heptose-7-phosphate kinase
LRITLGGGGTDLPSYYERFGGFVLSAAINKYVYICLNRPAADDLIRLKYSMSEEVATTAEIEHDLVRPALEMLNIHSNVEIASLADVPAGTGLGSSSTYLVALLTALQDMKRERLTPQTLAERAFKIEHDLAGHAVGKQDHYLAAFGGISCLEIERDGEVRVSPLNVSREMAEELRRRVLLFFTSISRDAQHILQEQHAATTRADGEVIDSLHKVKEIGFKVRAALEEGRLDDFGDLLHEHWLNKKRRSKGISNDRIDLWYEAARAAGARGAKIIGAGGGGFLMVCCSDGTAASIKQALAEMGLQEMTYNFDFEGAKVLVNF